MPESLTSHSCNLTLIPEPCATCHLSRSSSEPHPSNTSASNRKLANCFELPTAGRHAEPPSHPAVSLPDQNPPPPTPAHHRDQSIRPHRKPPNQPPFAPKRPSCYLSERPFPPKAPLNPLFIPRNRRRSAQHPADRGKKTRFPEIH